ncbi:MAG: penicillin-binding protein 2 [Nitrospinales bacterium]
MSLYQYKADVSEDVRKRIKIFAILVIVGFLGLWMRIWYLQIIKSQHFRGMSESNRIRLVSLPGYRGMMKDRNGETLVNIRPSFNLYIRPEDVKDLSKTLTALARKIDFDGDKAKQNLRKARPFQDVLVKADISRQEVAILEENKLSLPGVNLKVVPLRNYVYDDMASQTLGFLGEISRAKLENPRYANYRQGDLIGKDGLESVYENFLRGQKGYQEVEVDVSGRDLRVVNRLPPKSGNHLILTLDQRVQQTVERLMAGTPENPVSGSVVVMKAHTGEILAITSKPSFDPNRFATGISRAEWRDLVADAMHPLQNRAIDGQYPPGSTYKIITAYAGLQEKIITPETVIKCPGSFRLGRRTYRCWKKGGHGAITVYDALKQSCDVFFYTVGHHLGIDRLARYAGAFGLGRYTKINLTGEKPGLIPTSEWKKSARGESWLPGETISASIGQGYNLVTPLQQANLMAAVANGGILLRPYLVKRIEDPDGNVVEEFHPRVERRIDIQPETLTLIRDALRGVVNEPHGTARSARLKNVLVAGKTGTAQVVGMKKGDEELDKEEIPYRFRDHAWFIAFAPYERPEIVVSIIVEHGGHGGHTAAPIAREIMKTYFKLYPLSS